MTLEEAQQKARRIFDEEVYVNESGIDPITLDKALAQIVKDTWEAGYLAGQEDVRGY